MSMLTIENTKLELRRDEKGKFVLFFDGKYVPGVMSVDVKQPHGLHPEFVITFAGVAVRVVERETKSEADTICELLQECGR